MDELPIVAPGYETEAPEEDLSACLMNTCVIDRAVLTEAMGAAMRTPLFRVLRVGEALLMVLCLGVLIWALAAGAGTGPVAWSLLLLAMTGFFYLQQFVIYPRRAVKNQLLRQALDEGSTALVNRLYFTPDRVANRRGDGDQILHMDYEKIKRVTQTPNLFVLTTRRNRLIPLDKAGFRNGGPEDFLALMAEKVK